MQSKTATCARLWERWTAVPAAPSWTHGAAGEWRRFIETSGWEERFLKRERRIDALCWVIVAISILYFIPVCFRAVAG